MQVTLLRFVSLLPFTWLVWAPGSAAADNPTVAQVLAACSRGAASGGQGVDSAMCEWYAVPCDCRPKAADSPTAPHWCVPDTEPVDTTMGRVVTELRRYSDQSAPIDRVVTGIILRLYPCQQCALN